MLVLILKFLLASLVGLSLGIIGGGGSILTVPILVYAFGVKPELSTSYSLFIVGLTTLIGSVSYYRNNLISVRTAITFVLPSILSIFVTRRFLMPVIPDVLLRNESFHITKDILIMVVFAVLMVSAAISMIRSKNTELPQQSKDAGNVWFIMIEGVIVGALAGFVGAGGGFLIIPALVLFANMPMKKAIGTSLLIISINSLLGFSGDVVAGVAIDWKFLGLFSVFTVSGILLGSKLAGKISPRKLKPAFGWFVLLMGVYILYREAAVIM